MALLIINVYNCRRFNMSRYKEIDIAVQNLMAANPIVDPLANIIEDEHLELHYEYLFEAGVSESLLEVIDDPVYNEFWANLADNFDEYFLDNGIAVRTYESEEFQDLSLEEKRIVSSRFALSMLEMAKKEIQQRIDMAILGRQSA